MSVIGMVLLFPKNIETAKVLNEDDFFVPAHQTIWAVVRDLADTEDHPVELASVVGRLEVAGDLDKVGPGPAGQVGVSYLLHLVDQAPAGLAEYYVGRVVEHSARRRVLRALAEITDAVRRGLPPSVAAGEALGSLKALEPASEST